MKCQPTSLDVIRFETDVVRKMMRDERWYEGERRSREISEKDIERRVEEIVLANGGKMRDEAVEQLVSIMCGKMDHDCKKCPYRVSFD